MRRMSTIASAAWLMALALGQFAAAQEPIEEVAEPLPAGGVIPQRTDLFSTYTDAYMNPESVRPANPHAREEQFYPPRAMRLYGGPDVMYYDRSRGANRVLLNRLTLFGPVAVQQTDDFDVGKELGIRSRIGLVLPSENKVEFSYFFNRDFQAATLTSQVIGINFLGNATAVSTADYAFDLQGAELLYRRSIFEYLRGDWKLDLLLGIRYLALDESFGYADQLVRYFAQVDNDIVGPEVGLNARLPFLTYFEFDLGAKGGFMANFQSNRIGVGPLNLAPVLDFNKQTTDTSGVIEGNLGVNITPFRNLRIRAGWEFIWMVNVGSAFGEIVPDAIIRDSRPSNNEQLLFHGWYLGGELTF